MVDHFLEKEMAFEGTSASLSKIDMLIKNVHKFVLGSSTKIV